MNLETVHSRNPSDIHRCVKCFLPSFVYSLKVARRSHQQQDEQSETPSDFREGKVTFNLGSQESTVRWCLFSLFLLRGGPLSVVGPGRVGWGNSKGWSREMAGVQAGQVYLPSGDGVQPQWWESRACRHHGPVKVRCSWRGLSKSCEDRLWSQ